MFGHRKDGRIIKNMPAFFKVIPYIMKERSDSHVYYTQDIEVKYIDEYIDRVKKEKDIKLSYMNIIYAAIVRLLAERPGLNRFVINGRTFARDGIYVSLAIKKDMTDGGEETTLKIRFDGSENIFEIAEKLNKTIKANKETTENNTTSNFAKILSHVPNFVIRLVVNFLIWSDKHGIMPKAVIDLSPFHTSAFLTNMGSLGIDAIYHHIYNFGTCGIFIAMGKRKKGWIYEEDEIKQEKSMSIAIVGDERICDGFYYASSMKSLLKYLMKPEVLEANIVPKQDIE